jgi:hypothetical protein
MDCGWEAWNRPPHPPVSPLRGLPVIILPSPDRSSFALTGCQIHMASPTASRSRARRIALPVRFALLLPGRLLLGMCMHGTAGTVLLLLGRLLLLHLSLAVPRLPGRHLLLLGRLHLLLGRLHLLLGILHLLLGRLHLLLGGFLNLVLVRNPRMVLTMANSRRRRSRA